MKRSWLPRVLVGVLALAALCTLAGEASAQQAQTRFGPSPYWHYPYYYFPHSYWPAQGPRYPEPIGAPYMAPPQYMAYPPFKEPHWRYEWLKPQSYHRGFHFWLDQF